MKSAIITGGDGFLGANLTKHLIANGYMVYAIVVKESRNKKRIENLQNVYIIEADLNKYKEVIDLLPGNSTVFFHLAWAGVTPGQRSDFIYQFQNIELSINAVRLAAAVHTQRFVFPGSTMEYVYYGKPIDKDAIPSPQNAYGVAKLSARYACSILCKQLGVSFIYAVISGIYSEDRNDNNVIYYTIIKLLNGEKPSLTKLEQLWDYVHVDDVVYGLQLVAEKGRPDAFYTIGHGDNWPLANYIYKIRDAINPELPLGIGDIEYSNDKIPSSCVSLDAMYEDTGFIPKVPFDAGVKRVIAEVKKRMFYRKFC